MTAISKSVKSLAEIEQLVPGFRKVWPKIKEACGTKQRCPKHVRITDEAEAVYPGDADVAKRFALKLDDMTLSHSVHISAGEWAAHAGRNNDGAMNDVPSTHAVLTCVYNDYYRSFSLTIQAKELVKALTA